MGSLLCRGRLHCDTEEGSAGSRLLADVTGSMMLAPANTPVTLLKASSFQLSEVGVAPRSCALSPFQRPGTEMGDLSETRNSHVSLLAKGNTQPCICSENHSLC